LTRIIHPQEFYQSIDNINYARRRTFGEKIVYSILGLCFLLGLIIFIVGLALIAVPTKAVWIALIAGGGGISIVSLCIGVFVIFWINRLRTFRLNEAINAESMKYSTKLPIPTNWRLNVHTYTSTLIRNGNSVHTVHGEIYFVSNIIWINYILLKQYQYFD